MFNTILCALDGSSHARRALALAIDLANKYKAQLLLAHVLLRNTDTGALQQFAKIEGLAQQVQPELLRIQGMDARLDFGAAYDDKAFSSRILVEIGQHILDDASKAAKQSGLNDVSVLLLDGDPADRLIACITEHGVDCVVIGSRGLSNIKGLFLGSVSHKVANRAPCTCIAVK